MKAGKTTKGNKDSISKRLGIKLYAGEKATVGNILIRQRGTKYLAGSNTYYGNDFTIHANVDGVVKYGKKFGKSIVSVTVK
ncbi:MAG: bL27 family ribosomal protein [bacterium]|nr:bL27 family ribosomal protein [bacterium]